MDLPRYTVIIPMRHFRADEPALEGLRENPGPDGGTVQILVAEGVHPARQRNAALALARGEIVVFLDNDCCVAPDFWKELDAAFARPEVEIVGGPALLRPEATATEKIFHALLTHVLVVGTISARYKPRGDFRRATQTDLILCNLAVRKSIFSRIGPLSTDLYPNEENEWLDRAEAAGVGAYYDPALQVFRPQRSGPVQMVKMLLRYGMGRTRQFRVSGWRPTFHQFLPLLLIFAGVAVIVGKLEFAFVVLWLIASAVIAVSSDASLGIWQSSLVGLLAPLVPIVYAVGQIAGWIALAIPTPRAESAVTVFDQTGARLSPP